MPINVNISVELWPISRLIPRVTNPRTHTPEQVKQVAASIKEFGWTNPILVGADNDVIAGHARLLAARQLQLTEVPVIQLAHLSDSQRRALVIADNQLALNAGWSEEMLQLELQALQEADFDLSIVGFDDEELARLLAAQEATTGLTDEDAVPEVLEAPISVAGDLWQLGPHTLLVGDATNEADVARLMNGHAADLVFTDPPYNVDYEGYTEDRLTIQGDKMTNEQFCKFLAATFGNYRRIVKPGASLYVCHPSSWQREFQNALEASGFDVRCQFVQFRLPLHQLHALVIQIGHQRIDIFRAKTPEMRRRILGRETRRMQDRAELGEDQPPGDSEIEQGGDDCEYPA